jgi:hypothetical protein
MLFNEIKTLNRIRCKTHCGIKPQRSQSAQIFDMLTQKLKTLCDLRALCGEKTLLQNTQKLFLAPDYFK